jgi:Fic family protein
MIMKLPEKPPNQNNSIKAMTLLFRGKIPADTQEQVDKLTIDDYNYWDEIKYKVKSGGTSEDVWALIKFQRAILRQTIEFSEITGFKFFFNTPGFLQKDLHELDMNLGGMLQSDNLIPAEEKNRYLISSIMEEAIASSQLEGAATTRKVAREMLEKNKKPQNRSERMIANNYETMQWIVKNKEKKLTPVTLLYIHRLITNDTMENKEEEGAFRDNDNVTVNDDITNEVFYIPPSYSHIRQLMKDFCEFANDEDKGTTFIHPIVKGIILHFLVGYIHPFADGNGRTARAIFYWYLIRKGYWLIEYMSVSRIILRTKSQYARAYLYTEYDENDLTYFVIYNIKAIKAALDDLKKYIHKKTVEKKNILSLIRDTGFNDRQVVLIKDILQDRNQFFTVKQIEARFSVSNQTARNDLNGLVKKKILEEKIIGKKSQFFTASNFEKQLKLQ